MKLYFKNSNGKRTAIAAPSTRDEAWEIIKAFCKERKFEIHYVRTWEDQDGNEIYDVGSWSEFFILVGN